MKFNATNLNKRTRLDTYLSRIYPQISRSTSKKIINEGIVSINGTNPKFNKILVDGDVIEINEELLKKYSQDNNVNKVAVTEMKLDIVFEDKDIVVLNKDEGIVVHPSYNHLEDTLLNGLAYYIQEKGENFSRVRPVNRLDKETSGIIMFSKNLDAHNFYSKQFKRREVTKEYLAVVKGDFGEYLNGRDFIKVSTFISKSPEGYKYRVSTDSLKGEYSESDIYFLKSITINDEIFSLLKVFPLTGRTHQIRVHLEHLGFPIVGDSLYNGLSFTRLLLHSHTLKVKDPNGNYVTYTAEPKNWVYD